MDTEYTAVIAMLPTTASLRPGQVERTDGPTINMTAVSILKFAEEVDPESVRTRRRRRTKIGCGR